MKPIYMYEYKAALSDGTDISMRCANLKVFRSLVKKYDKKSSITKITMTLAFTGDNDTGFGIEEYNKVIWEAK